MIKKVWAHIILVRNIITKNFNKQVFTASCNWHTKKFHSDKWTNYYLCLSESLFFTLRFLTTIPYSFITQPFFIYKGPHLYSNMLEKLYIGGPIYTFKRYCKLFAPEVYVFNIKMGRSSPWLFLNACFFYQQKETLI